MKTLNDNGLIDLQNKYDKGAKYDIKTGYYIDPFFVNIFGDMISLSITTHTLAECKKVINEIEKYSNDFVAIKQVFKGYNTKQTTIKRRVA